MRDIIYTSEAYKVVKIENTYAWIMATAVSSVIRRNCVDKVMRNRLMGLPGMRFLRRVNKRCPAIMLAASRTERVMGRMILLVISIMIIKGIRGVGVPNGTRWARKLVILFQRENRMKPSQKGRAKDKEMVRCLVEVKENANNPRMLLKKIRKNNDEIRSILVLFLRRVSSCEASIFNISLISERGGEENTQ